MGKIKIIWTKGSPHPDLDPGELEQVVAGFIARLGQSDKFVVVMMGDDEALRELNRDYREKDAPTDILSWSYLENLPKPPRPLPQTLPLPLSQPRSQPQTLSQSSHPSGSNHDALSEPPAKTPKDGMPTEVILGELALSLETAERQAGENGWGLRTEVLRLLAHGCAHLVGYDHQTPTEDRDMKMLEVELLEGAELKGIYPEDGPD